ncbi:hypothetical protein [Sulfurisphaera ohwakuensis]|uniref:Uncharacterized protein n=1 Tax=Sulfurisphaera ohwakuensis TaxID=69656 RepID=A0A650CG06_SULOH|nr:hypothetical protein [Sulfurisphaera ohwakuensis]MBB5254487.1 hypothetical protein [Sulfurisphaera ohwakuensis]QGR16709.1 hypothetical protein D1869_05550 [Sulfurisphaera ohwakuensis]
MQGNDEERSFEKNSKIRDLVYSINFVRPLPQNLFSTIFMTNSLEFKIGNTNVNLMLDERNNNFVKQIIFTGDEVQKWVEYFLIYLKEKFSLKLEDIVWCYEVYLELESDYNNKKINLNIPSVLPLIGNVTNYGIIITNDQDFKMISRNFTTVQIDKRIRLIKRSQDYINISSLLRDLQDLLDKLKI